jgi:hypothetical protein
MVLFSLRVEEYTNIVLFSLRVEEYTNMVLFSLKSGGIHSYGIIFT